MISSVFGLKARFCNEGCRESYKCDRECCLIYPPVKFEGDPQLYGVDEASIMGNFCAYCNTEIDPETEEGPKPEERTKTTRRPCDQCDIMYINGVRCHETGCPNRND